MMTAKEAYERIWGDENEDDNDRRGKGKGGILAGGDGPAVYVDIHKDAVTLGEEEGRGGGGLGEGERGRTEEILLVRTARVMIWGYESDGIPADLLLPPETDERWGRRRAAVVVGRSVPSPPLS